MLDGNQATSLGGFRIPKLIRTVTGNWNAKAIILVFQQFGCSKRDVIRLRCAGRIVISVHQTRRNMVQTLGQCNPHHNHGTAGGGRCLSEKTRRAHLQTAPYQQIHTHPRPKIECACGAVPYLHDLNSFSWLSVYHIACRYSNAVSFACFQPMSFTKSD